MGTNHTKHSPITSEELIEVLGLTIKKDDSNKLVTFLCQLSAYTEDSQFNISYNAPSATGKSYIPIELSQLFPREDVIATGYSSPTAFFHDIGEFDKELKGYRVDLERKILIFLDQPHTQLLEHLRPLLSHDKKEIQLKITDKSQKAGLRTKNIFIIGFPSVTFCTGSLRIDEQEATRLLLLSPEITQEKIREAIFEKVKKETDPEAYQRWLDENPERRLLKERIKAIRDEKIREIKVGNPKKLEEAFFKKNRLLKPRHQRDIARLISFVKVFALLNLWWRERQGSTITANDDDIDEALKVWEKISKSQEYNLPPYIYQLYQEVILPAYQKKNSELNGGVGIGLTRQEILRKHFEVYGRFLDDWKFRQQILPMLETSGLVTVEPDQLDRRRMLIYPTTLLTISKDQNNSESEGGVQPIKVKFEDLSKPEQYYVEMADKFGKEDEKLIDEILQDSKP